jgi:galactarate dehydratase
MGSIVKSGTAPISGVVPPGERARAKGLLYAATPASDFVCGTLQLAAGMDVDAGRIATGEVTIEELGWELFHTILDVASGRWRTWTEKWQLHNALALFNPAPVT